MYLLNLHLTKYACEIAKYVNIKYVKSCIFLMSLTEML